MKNQTLYNDILQDIQEVLILFKSDPVNDMTISQIRNIIHSRIQQYQKNGDVDTFMVSVADPKPDKIRASVFYKDKLWGECKNIFVSLYNGNVTLDIRTPTKAEKFDRAMKGV